MPEANEDNNTVSIPVQIIAALTDDEYEDNDWVADATEIEVGQTYQAKGLDDDNYAFVVPEGITTIELKVNDISVSQTQCRVDIYNQYDQHIQYGSCDLGNNSYIFDVVAGEAYYFEIRNMVYGTSYSFQVLETSQIATSQSNTKNRALTSSTKQKSALMQQGSNTVMH